MILGDQITRGHYVYSMIWLIYRNKQHFCNTEIFIWQKTDFGMKTTHNTTINFY